MADERQIFDVASSELHRAVNLIEASAGTGKTYAIAMLVLRFIVEFSLKIEDILLVTFTRAATEELAERVRKRLVEAKSVLEGSLAAAGTDATLIRWAEKVKEPEPALQRIRAALLEIDRAPIFTIHGFCQRMLQEQALESGQLFDVELQPDIEAVKEEIVQDFWRRQFYSLPRRQCGVIRVHYSSPEELYHSIAPVNQTFSTIAPQVVSLEKAAETFANCFTGLSSWWRDRGEELSADLENLSAQGLMKKGFAMSLPQWRRELDDYFEKITYNFPQTLHLLTRNGLKEQINGSKVRGKKQEELLDRLSLPGSLVDKMLNSVSELLLSVRISLAQYILEETERRMLERGIMSYDDLIIRLHRAVTDSTAPHMLQLLKSRYKAAVIDEFQDTDALQWRIFASVFADSSHFLYLIGDPKQAIYRFRGADIHSYFLAKKSAKYRLTLEKNYRSHPGVVEGVNELFSVRGRPFFFSEEMLGFARARAALDVENCQLLSSDGPMANMAYCQLYQNPESKDGLWTSARAAEAIMRFVVKEIVRLLTEDIRLHGKKKSSPLRPGDIAVLVKHNSHAEQYLTVLAQAGVPAVTASRGSVFASRECAELYHLLNALANPGDITLLKRAMSISWFGFTGNELYQIWEDERLFDSYFSRFQEHAMTWQSRGVLMAIKHVLKAEEVGEVLGATERAERRFANINHLAELLQEAEEENLYGPLQLLRWLRKSMDLASKEEELRLESDDEAVRIITMHGAKGLEYPVVFCPFLWYRQTRLEKEKERVVCQEENGTVLDLGSEQFEVRREQALREEMAEELRLCYVAVTRAKLRCYLMWCDLKAYKGKTADSFDSALGYLLFPQGRVSFEEQRKALMAKNGRRFSKFVAIEDKPVVPYCYSGRNAGVELKGRIRRRDLRHSEQQMTSYSALAASTSHGEQYQEIQDPDSTGDSGELQGDAIRFASLPAGPGFGNIVHDILEQISFADLATPEMRRSEVELICRKYGLDVNIDQLLELLRTVVCTPLNPGRVQAVDGFTLASLDGMKCLKEMGFYFHLQRGSTGDLNRLLALEKTVGKVADRKISGFLTGFVDLIFQHDERFYIADYKTNHLGDQGQDYSLANLIEAMASHNYGLQYYIYSLVLHRYLKNFKESYDYERHFGGIFYLFVRGMDESGRGVYYHKPDLQILEGLENCFVSKR